MVAGGDLEPNRGKSLPASRFKKLAEPRRLPATRPVRTVPNPAVVAYSNRLSPCSKPGWPRANSSRRAGSLGHPWAAS